MAQISTSSSGTESVLELTYFPSSLLFILSIFRSTQSFPPIKHRYSRLSRVLSGLSLCWVGSSFVFFPRFHRANDFHRHVPRHCEIKPLTIALIIRGTRGGGLLLEGADGCVALFKRDMGKSIARLSVGNLAWHRRKVFAESRTRSIIYAITTALCFLKRYEKITHAWYSTPGKNRDLYIRLYRYTRRNNRRNYG